MRLRLPFQRWTWSASGRWCHKKKRSPCLRPTRQPSPCTCCHLLPFSPFHPSPLTSRTDAPTSSLSRTHSHPPVRVATNRQHLVRLRECLQVLFELDSVRILVLRFHIGLVQINVVLHEGFLVQRLVVMHLSPDCTSLMKWRREGGRGSRRACTRVSTPRGPRKHISPSVATSSADTFPRHSITHTAARVSNVCTLCADEFLPLGLGAWQQKTRARCPSPTVSNTNRQRFGLNDVAHACLVHGASLCVGIRQAEEGHCMVTLAVGVSQVVGQNAIRLLRATSPPSALSTPQQRACLPACVPACLIIIIIIIIIIVTIIIIIIMIILIIIINRPWDEPQPRLHG